MDPVSTSEDRLDSRMDQPQGSGSQERRVYVGNLSYDVKWPQLKDFMRQAGEVTHADVLLLPNGRSKGCGIVEYATREEAEKAVDTLSNQTLMGRPVFVREDRESEVRVGGNIGAFAGPPRRGAPAPGPPNAQLFVGNLPFSVGWQDLKDLFRNAGQVVRADVQRNAANQSRGCGTVLFATASDAQNAITTYNGYDWNGRSIEVREDRYAGGGGGFSASAPPSMPPPSRPPPPRRQGDWEGTRGRGEPSETIFVGNLPWSTTNNDLVELFQTVGPVQRAEIQFLPNGRPAGTGVVRFDTAVTAQLAITNLDGYSYGNRSLGISFASQR